MKVLLVLVIGACTRSQPVEFASPDPSTQPLPSSTKAPPPDAPPPPEKFIGHACEPVVRCGVWSKCVWLGSIDGVRYRALSGPESGGIFVRRHECWPAGAGVAGCAMRCTGGDGGPPCVDGFHPEEETCTGAAAPKPNSVHCSLFDGVCGSLM